MAEGEKIITRVIEEEMKKSYMDYLTLLNRLKDLKKVDLVTK